MANTSDDLFRLFGCGRNGGDEAEAKVVLTYPKRGGGEGRIRVMQIGKLSVVDRTYDFFQKLLHPPLC